MHDPSTRHHEVLVHCVGYDQDQRNRSCQYLHWSDLTNLCWTSFARIALHKNPPGTFHAGRVFAAWILQPEFELNLCHCHPAHHKCPLRFHPLMWCSKMSRTHLNQKATLLCSECGTPFPSQGNWCGSMRLLAQRQASCQCGFLRKSRCPKPLCRWNDHYKRHHSCRRACHACHFCHCIHRCAMPLHSAQRLCSWLGQS